MRKLYFYYINDLTESMMFHKGTGELLSIKTHTDFWDDNCIVVYCLHMDALDSPNIYTYNDLICILNRDDAPHIRKYNTDEYEHDRSLISYVYPNDTVWIHPPQFIISYNRAS